MIILISGASASGKSTLSMELSKVISAIVVPQDAFYNCEFDLFPYDKETNGVIEQPDIIDWDKLIKTIKSIPDNVNIIVEGHCVFTCWDLVMMADHCFFIDIGFEKCMDRFIKRNADNYTPDMLKSKKEYFIKYTWPIHKEYQKNHMTDDVIIIQSNLEAINNIKKVIIVT